MGLCLVNPFTPYLNTRPVPLLWLTFIFGDNLWVSATDQQQLKKFNSRQITHSEKMADRWDCLVREQESLAFKTVSMVVGKTGNNKKNITFSVVLILRRGRTMSRWWTKNIFFPLDIYIDFALLKISDQTQIITKTKH